MVLSFPKPVSFNMFSMLLQDDQNNSPPIAKVEQTSEFMFCKDNQTFFTNFAGKHRKILNQNSIQWSFPKVLQICYLLPGFIIASSKKEIEIRLYLDGTLCQTIDLCATPRLQVLTSDNLVQLGASELYVYGALGNEEQIQWLLAV